MKTKFLSVAIIAVLLYSCATKQPAVTPEPPAPPATPTVAISPEGPPAPLSKELQEGKDLYENNCAKCHKLFKPNDYSKEQWGPIVVRMQKKARLDDAQTGSIYAYLTNDLK